MQAYNKEELNNYFLVEKAKALYVSKFITKEQLLTIHNSLLKLKTHDNFLVRILFFLLGAFLYSSIAAAFAAVLLTGSSDNAYKVLLFFYAIVGLLGSEFLAKEKYFRHGLDDAFILGFQLCFCVALGAISEEPLVGFLAMIVSGAFCCIRYLNTLSIIVFCSGFVCVFLNLSVEHNVLDAMYLPFIGFILAIVFYFSSKKILDTKSWSVYEEIGNMMKLFSLLLGYFSMNYMIVRELSKDLIQIEVTPTKDIPFAFLFYGFTFLIPIFYIIMALKRKDRYFLWVGLFTLGYSIFTIRYYYSVLPTEYAMLIGGITLFVISFLAIKLWKDKTEGITFQPDRSSDSKLLQNAQMLIITTQSKIDMPTPKNDMPFGGGGFSGGGAGDTY